MTLLVDKFGAGECLAMLDRIEEVLKGKVGWKRPSVPFHLVPYNAAGVGLVGRVAVGTFPACGRGH